MQETVYRVIGVLCGVVAGTPIGTNLGLVHLLWMLVSGRLLETRGAVIPGLSCDGAVGAGGASGVGGAGAGGLEQRRAAGTVAAARRAGGPVAGA